MDFEICQRDDRLFAFRARVGDDVVMWSAEGFLTKWAAIVAVVQAVHASEGATVPAEISG